MISKEVLKSLQYPVFSFTIQADKKSGFCYACGAKSEYKFAEFIDDELTERWGINASQRHAFSSRESRQCQACGATHRNRQMARAFCDVYDRWGSIDTLKELVENAEFKKLRFAEINACGGLHQFFIRQQNMIYSEYEPSDPAIPSEDLTKLSYADDSFDLVATSDSLEHIPDYKKALEEIYRILKPGGKHIFTIPVIWKNKTFGRAEMSPDGKVKYLVAPAYHGPPHDDNLVWTDFGEDILQVLDTIGFKTKVLYYNLINQDDAGCVFVSAKVK